MVEDGLSTVGLKTLPSETNFMFIDLKDLNAEKFRAAMADQGVDKRDLQRLYQLVQSQHGQVGRCTKIRGCPSSHD